MKKTLSIITVVKNDCDGLAKTIDSISQQLNDKTEYIVIDGKSNDETQNVIKKYDSLISFYISEEDKGIYHAMNKGLKFSTGKWIYFLNAGDLMSNGLVDKLIEQAQLLSEESILYGDIELNYSDINITRRVAGSHDNLDTTMSISHQAVLISRKVYETLNGYCTRFKLASDYDLLLRAKHHGYEFIYYPFIFAQFQLGGISDRRFFESRIEKLSILHRNQSSNILEGTVLVIREILENSIYHIVMQLLGENRAKAMRRSRLKRYTKEV